MVAARVAALLEMVAEAHGRLVQPPPPAGPPVDLPPPGATGPQPEPDSDADDPIEAIRKLGELREAGLVTDAEFLAKKTELLKRI